MSRSINDVYTVTLPLCSLAADVIVIPRSCSCSIQSICEAPSCVSPIYGYDLCSKEYVQSCCLTSINVSHDTDITSIFQRKVSCHVFFSFQYLLNKYYRYGDALSMSHLLVNHITEHTQGNCFNLTNGEQMLCSLQPFCECLHVFDCTTCIICSI